MDNSGEKPRAAIALESRLSEAAGYSDDFPAKPISRKKKNSRKRRHGESTSSRYKIMINHVGMLQSVRQRSSFNTKVKNTGSPYARTFHYTIFDRIVSLFSTGCILLVLCF